MENAKPQLARCDYCTGCVRWVETVNGKRMPLNPDPDQEGNVVFTQAVEWEGPVRVMTKPELDAPARRPRYKAHFATCSYSRRSAKGATPAARARTQRAFDDETRRRGEPER